MKSEECTAQGAEWVKRRLRRGGEEETEARGRRGDWATGRRGEEAKSFY